MRLEIEENAALNNLILCVEMLGFAILHAKAFPYSEFKTAIPDVNVLEVSKLTAKGIIFNSIYRSL